MQFVAHDSQLEGGVLEDLDELEQLIGGNYSQQVPGSKGRAVNVTTSLMQPTSTHLRLV